MNTLTILQGLLLLAFAILGLYAAIKLSKHSKLDEEHN